MDTSPLRDAYDAFLDAAALVTGPGAVSLTPPAGEWDAEVLLDQPLPLRDIFTGLAGNELPGHTGQLLALLPDGARAGGGFRIIRA